VEARRNLSNSARIKHAFKQESTTITKEKAIKTEIQESPKDNKKHSKEHIHSLDLKSLSEQKAK
jgi:hypothetical protein